MTGLAELAEDTAVYLLPRPGFEMQDRGEFVFEASGNRCSVHRLRLGDVDAALRWTRAEARRRNVARLEWWVGWNATPPDLPERLLALGLVPDDEAAWLRGMTCETPPSAVPDVDVRRIETVDQQLEAVRVDWDVWQIDAAGRERRAAVERDRFDPNGTVHHFAAYVDDEPVGFGRAIDMKAGVALMGGAVLAAFRGHGVYRALVRARWDHAVARGTPLLVVQAGHMSAPVLAGLGFVSHGELRLYVDDVTR